MSYNNAVCTSPRQLTAVESQAACENETAVCADPDVSIMSASEESGLRRRSFGGAMKGSVPACTDATGDAGSTDAVWEERSPSVLSGSSLSGNSAPEKDSSYLPAALKRPLRVKTTPPAWKEHSVPHAYAYMHDARSTPNWTRPTSAVPLAPYSAGVYMPHPLALYAPSPYAGTLGLGPCSLQAPPCVYYCPLPPEGYAKALMAYAETGDRADSGHGHEPAMAESLPPNATRVPLYPRSPFPLPLPAPFPRRASARMARSQRTGGSYDPSQFEIFPERAAADGRTTVMLRNVPNRYSQRFLMDHLRGRGLADRFDFVYLPIDFRSRCNLGYAFVNLMTPADVAQLHAAYQNHLWESGCSKVCCASYARIQGREALICHFLDARFALDDPEVMPVVFARTEGGKAFDPVSVQNYIARRQLAVGATEGGDAPAAGRSEEGAQGDVPGGTGDPARSDAEAAGAAEQPSAPPRGDSDSASGRSAEDELHEDCAPRPPSPFATDAPFRGTEVTSNSDSLADTFALPTSLSDALVLEDVSDDADDPPGSSAARRKESQPCHDSASSVHGEALDSHSLPKLSSATPA